MNNVEKVGAQLGEGMRAIDIWPNDIQPIDFWPNDIQPIDFWPNDIQPNGVVFIL